MEINKLGKVALNQSVQDEKPAVQTKPVIQAGVGSVPDTFETAENRLSPNALGSALGAFRQSIKDMNEEKKAYLEKLQEHNKAADELSEELERLAELSSELSAKEKGKDEDEDPVVVIKSTRSDLKIADAMKGKSD
jgi:chromosome segregation ATPase